MKASAHIPCAVPVEVKRRTTNSPLKLLFVTGSLYSRESGPFQSLLSTVVELQNQGHNALVAGTKDRADQSSSPPSWPNAIAFKKRGPYSLHYAPKFRFWMEQDRTQVDVVNLQSVWNHNNYAAARWCVANKVPYVITGHGNFNPTALSISSWKKHLAKQLYVDFVLKHASCLHAVNEPEYANMRRYGLKQPVCVVPNGARLPETVSGAGMKPCKTCLYLGRLHPIKNLEAFIRAWHAVGTARKGWQLVLAGPDDGGHRAVLEHLMSSLGLNDVRFAGRQDEDGKHRSFLQADCFVLPSLSEGAPVALVEALSYGLPALLTSQCNFPEGALKGAAVEVFSSLVGLQEGLTRILLMSDSERAQMGRRGRRLIAERYQWKSIVAELTDVYLWLAKRHVAPKCVRFD